jgi:hypothetical protein
MRRTTRKYAARLVSTARERIGDVMLSEDAWTAIEDAALVTCWGRATVPRDGYRRDVTGPHTVEEPMRLVRQLGLLARGLVAIGLTEAEAIAITRRAALDSMPLARREVLAVLTEIETANTSTVASAAGLHRHVAGRALEDLEVVGVVAGDRGTWIGPGEGESDRRMVMWRLTGADGQLIIDVFARSRGGE